MFGYIKKSEVEAMLLKQKRTLREELEMEVRQPSAPAKYMNILGSGYSNPKPLGMHHEELREDFEEVDQKIDKMEKYLGIEYVELTGNISHDDVAESVNTKEYRKLETFKK